MGPYCAGFCLLVLVDPDKCVEYVQQFGALFRMPDCLWYILASAWLAKKFDFFSRFFFFFGHV